MTLSRWRAESENSAPNARVYPWRRDDVDTDDLASAEVAEEVEREDSEENVRSGEEYEEIAGVAGIDGDGEEARRGAIALNSVDRRGASMLFEFEMFNVGCFTGPNFVDLRRVKINHYHVLSDGYSAGVM